MMFDLLSNATSMTEDQIMQPIGKMQTNTPYGIDIDNTIGVITQLEDNGFTVTRTIK